ncbi:MAG: hypothetical protein SNJ64_02825 [Endomicrobiia bacterium]
MKKCKKIGLNIFFCIMLSLSLNIYNGLINTPIEKLHNFTLVSLSLNNFFSTDLENKILPVQKVELLFIENIYRILFVQDLTKNEVIKSILSKPFSKLWIVMQFLLSFGKMCIVAIFNDIKLSFTKIKFFVIKTTFLITFLIALTRLKTRWTAPLVLRC